jgi:hypothetical protein
VPYQLRAAKWLSVAAHRHGLRLRDFWATSALGAGPWPCGQLHKQGKTAKDIAVSLGWQPGSGYGLWASVGRATPAQRIHCPIPALGARNRPQRESEIEVPFCPA